MAAAAGIAQHLEPAHDAGAEQMAIVQPVLGEHVILERLQVVLGEKLPGKEARADHGVGLAAATAA